MDDDATSFDEAAEDILTYDAPDEALEAAGMEKFRASYMATCNIHKPGC